MAGLLSFWNARHPAHVRNRFVEHRREREAAPCRPAYAHGWSVATRIASMGEARRAIRVITAAASRPRTAAPAASRRATTLEGGQPGLVGVPRREWRDRVHE
jgi:hypothetical protein